MISIFMVAKDLQRVFWETMRRRERVYSNSAKLQNRKTGLKNYITTNQLDHKMYLNPLNTNLVKMLVYFKKLPLHIQQRA